MFCCVSAPETDVIC